MIKGYLACEKMELIAVHERLTEFIRSDGGAD